MSQRWFMQPAVSVRMVLELVEGAFAQVITARVPPTLPATTLLDLGTVAPAGLRAVAAVRVVTATAATTPAVAFTATAGDHEYERLVGG